MQFEIFEQVNYQKLYQQKPSSYQIKERKEKLNLKKKERNKKLNQKSYKLKCLKFEKMEKLFTHMIVIYQNQKQNKKHKELNKKQQDSKHSTRRNTLLMSTANFLLLRQLNVGKNILVGGSLVGFAVFYYMNSYKQSIAKGQPYFQTPNDVIDLRRTFFHIDDDKNYSPSLFYPGRNLDKLKPAGLIQLLYRQQL